MGHNASGRRTLQRRFTNANAWSLDPLAPTALNGNHAFGQNQGHPLQSSCSREVLAEGFRVRSTHRAGGNLAQAPLSRLWRDRIK